MSRRHWYHRWIRRVSVAILRQSRKLRVEFSGLDYSKPRENLNAKTIPPNWWECLLMPEITHCEIALLTNNSAWHETFLLTLSCFRVAFSLLPSEGANKWVLRTPTAHGSFPQHHRRSATVINNSSTQTSAPGKLLLHCLSSQPGGKLLIYIDEAERKLKFQQRRIDFSEPQKDLVICSSRESLVDIKFIKIFSVSGIIRRHVSKSLGIRSQSGEITSPESRLASSFDNFFICDQSAFSPSSPEKSSRVVFTHFSTLVQIAVIKYSLEQTRERLRAFSLAWSATTQHLARFFFVCHSQFMQGFSELNGFPLLHARNLFLSHFQLNDCFLNTVEASVLLAPFTNLCRG